MACFADGFGFVHSADAGLENETEENISFDLDNLSYQAGRGHAVAFHGVSLIDHYLVVSENGVYPANSHFNGEHDGKPLDIWV